MADVHFRPGTKRYKIAELARKGKTKQEAYDILKVSVEAQQKPFVFMQNIAGTREAKPMAEQLQELKHEIGRTYAQLGREDQ